MKYLINIAVMLFLVVRTVDGQGTTDTQLWSGLSGKIEVSKKFQFTLEQQFRFDNNISTFDRTLSEVGARWKMTKHLYLGSGFRYSVYPSSNNNYRFSGDLIYRYKKKKNPLRIQNRFRYQRRTEFETRDVTSYLRNKFTIDINASKIVDPYGYGEIFYRLDGKNEFRVWRAGFGLDWKLSKKLNLNTYYQLEQEFNKKVNDRIHVVGVMLEWNIN